MTQVHSEFPTARYAKDGESAVAAPESSKMPYVITEPCIGVKDKSCVDVCPVDCIKGDEEDPQLYIDPEVCIDCGACVSACPVEAIYADNDVPAKWEEYTEINAEYFRNK